MLNSRRKQQKGKWGKTRDLFRQIRNIKGAFHPKVGTIKDISGRDPVDAKEIRRNGKNTKKNCIKNRP